MFTKTLLRIVKATAKSVLLEDNEIQKISYVSESIYKNS